MARYRQVDNTISYARKALMGQSLSIFISAAITTWEFIFTKVKSIDNGDTMK